MNVPQPLFTCFIHRCLSKIYEKAEIPSTFLLTIKRHVDNYDLIKFLNSSTIKRKVLVIIISCDMVQVNILNQFCFFLAAIYDCCRRDISPSPLYPLCSCPRVRNVNRLLVVGDWLRKPGLVSAVAIGVSIREHLQLTLCLHGQRGLRSTSWELKIKTCSKWPLAA